jgi:hypothetical protein
MSKENNIETTSAFYWQLFNSSKYVLLLVVIASLIQLFLLPNLKLSYGIGLLLILTITKIGSIVVLAFNQLMKIIGQSHLLSHILILFGLLIGLIIFSFGVDFTALHLINDQNFKTNIEGDISLTSLFFEYLYMSTITFSSVGYGDMTPLTVVAKLVVMMEIALRFFVLVFGIANINQIRVNE